MFYSYEYWFDGKVVVWLLLFAAKFTNYNKSHSQTPVWFTGHKTTYVHGKFSQFPINTAFRLRYNLREYMYI